MQTLYEGPTIRTFWDPMPVAEALVAENGRILAVGTRMELHDRFPRARRVALPGAELIPAFNDCHCHILTVGLDAQKADLRACRSIPEIQRVLRDWAHRNPDEAWILGTAYNPNQLDEGRHITREELDAISQTHPIYLKHVNKHAAVINSAALRATDVVPREASDLGIDRADSKPLLGGAMKLVSRCIPKPGEEKMTRAIQAAAVVMSARGIMSASDAAVGSIDLVKELRAYATALGRGASLRVTLMPLYEAVERLGWLDLGPDAQELRDWTAMHPDLRIGPIKLFADGTVMTHTAALRSPYVDADHAGSLMYEKEILWERIDRAHRAGWQVAVHAVGDRAIDVALDGFQRAQERSPQIPTRHRIEHCLMLMDDQMQRMTALGVTAVAQPELLWDFAAYARKHLGERADQMMAFRKWKRHGIQFACSSDQPVVPGQPLNGWRTAVTRTGVGGYQNGIEERLEPVEALSLFTVAGAAVTRDPELGPLAPGKLAHFIALSHPAEQIADGELHLVPFTEG